MPVGGTTGQVLRKINNTDFATEWGTVSGGATAWGDISGTLANQTDLQSALNSKASTSHNHDGTYEAANANIQAHIASAHAPSNAEQNVNADWNSVSGDSQILNKPTLGDAAAKNTGTSAGTVAAGDHTHAQLHDRQHSITATADHTFPGGTTTFLRADGTFATPSGGGTAEILTNANTADVSANATDTYLTGSGLTVGGRIKAGTTIRWRLAMTKTAAGTAAATVNIRFGTNGTTADTARVTWTTTPQTQAIDTGWMEIQVIIRSVSATGTVNGVLHFTHLNTTTGLLNKNTPHIAQTTSATFDNTAAGLIVGISVNPGASNNWTFQHVSAEAKNLN